MGYTHGSSLHLFKCGSEEILIHKASAVFSFFEALLCVQINVGKVRTHIRTLGMLEGSPLFLVIAPVNSLHLLLSLSFHKLIHSDFIFQSEDRPSKISNTFQRGFR